MFKLMDKKIFTIDDQNFHLARPMDTDYLCFQLLSAITGKLEVKDGPMEQDLAEGVDSDEWVSLSTEPRLNLEYLVFLILTAF